MIGQIGVLSVLIYGAYSNTVALVVPKIRWTMCVCVQGYEAFSGTRD